MGSKEASSRYSRFILRHWLNLVAALLVASVLFNFYAIFILAKRNPFDEEKILTWSAALKIREVRPNLRKVRVTMPGRPHPLPFRREDPGYIDALRKRKVFSCSTDGLGFRLTGTPPPGNSLKIACMGASVTFGLGVEDGETYPAALAALLNDESNPARRCVALNAGVPGQTTPEIRRMLDAVVLPLKPDVVIINHEYNNVSEYGRHLDRVHFRQRLDEKDYEKLLGGFVSDLAAMIESCQRLGVGVIVLGSPYNSFFPFQDAALFHKAGIQTARRFGVPWVDACAPLLEEEEEKGIVLMRKGDRQQVIRAARLGGEILFDTPYPWRNDRQHVSAEVYAFLDGRSSPEQYIFIDGSHPRPHGHRLIADHLKQALEKMSGFPSRR
jgi:lysophospholipase L1-like esterase